MAMACAFQVIYHPLSRNAPSRQIFFFPALLVLKVGKPSTTTPWTTCTYEHSHTQLMGSTCGVAIAYAFPALLVLKVGPSANKARRKTAAYCMLAVAVLLAAVTAVERLLDPGAGEGSEPG